MAKSLIIVESPAKVKTIKSFVGSQYEVRSSVGHIRDLPESTLGVDVEKNFAPKYVVPKEKAKVVKDLKEAAARAEQVLLATDPDREGEAISWHIAEALKLKNPVRIEFNEITRDAVTRALKKPRAIDMNRVNAQQARRILDRLVGYKLSPLLWKKIRRGLSAGRVQSVTVRLVCEREREIQGHARREYWSLVASLTPDDETSRFRARLVQVGEHKLDAAAVREDPSAFRLGSEDEANALLARLRAAEYRVREFRRQERRRNPAPPFITSTLQQQASIHCGFTPAVTMSIAQRLYEGKDLGAEGTVGLITYMRTDATRVAAEAEREAQTVIRARYGEEFVPERPPQYRSRANAQEAHEAIRPSSSARHPDVVAEFLSEQERKLYDLIWKRFVASQMVPAVLDTATAEIAAGDCQFRASASKVKFSGFLAVYEEDEEDTDTESDDPDKQTELPELTPDQLVHLLELASKQHFTEPPARYSEASLVKAMEEKGIGRPSTYAAIIRTIVDRGYVGNERRRLFATELGFTVNDRLIGHFPEIMEVDFTANLESRLDQVEEGTEDWVELLRGFYAQFNRDLQQASEAMEGRKAEPIGEDCPACGKPLVRRDSKNGEFVACSGYPECKYVKQELAGVDCQLCGKAMIIRSSRTEKFLGCSGYPECNFTQPFVDPNALLPTEAPQSCPDCGKPLIARKGRFGPFLACAGYPTCKYILKQKVQRKPAEPAGFNCPKCAKPMLKRDSARGEFYGCSGYPKCKTTYPLENVTFNADGQVTLTEPVRPQVEMSDQPCPKCGALMVVRNSARGKFLGCSKFPKCRGIKRIEGEERTGVACPRAGCGGEIVMKRTKSRKFFYGCNRYPDCEFAVWGKPIGERCSECNALLIEKTNRAGETQIACSNSDCGAEAAL